ncbi:MAG: YiiX/YebB-like N1pC/P60 family cysteine hydrolase [Syntrophomonadaceae bacterium]
MDIRNSRVRLAVFPLLGLLLAAAIILHNIDILASGKTVIFDYWQNLRQGNVGYGHVSAFNNNIQLDNLQPGDILLGGWPDCAYGLFSHTALYLGHGKVLEGYIESGITINPVDHFKEYAWACILRVKTSEKVKAQVIDYALRQQGKIFYPLAFKNGTNYWNCSKIIWKAYKEQNIDLESADDLWIAPEVFRDSQYVEIIDS